MIDWLARGYTPIFEYVAPRNRIVVGYSKEDFVYLAMRRNLDGEYVTPEVLYPGTCVEEFGSLDGSIEEYVKRVRNQEGREGDVLAFDDGQRFKIKSEWYLDIHKIKSQMSNGRHIARRVLDNDLDDMLSVLESDDREISRKYAQAFSTAIDAEWKRIERQIAMMDAWLDELKPENKHKAVAVEYMPRMKITADRTYLFGHLSGKNVRKMFDKQVNRMLNSNTKFDTMTQGWELPSLLPTETE